MLVVVIGRAVNQGNGAPGDARGRSVETVVDTQLETTHVEVIEVAVERAIPIPWLQMSIVFFAETFTEEVTDMTERN